MPRGVHNSPRGGGNGAPPKITKAWADKRACLLADLWKEGASLAEVAVALDVCKQSYYKACEISSKFRDADRKGQALCEAWWARMGRAGTFGKCTIMPTMWIFNMRNRFKYSWNNEGNNEEEKKQIVEIKLSKEESKEIRDCFEDDS